MKLQCRLSLAAALLAAVLVASPLLAWAQSEPAPSTPALLAGTLAKVRDAGSVAIGYRDSSVPFSYLSARNEPIGYSIELCRSVVSAIGDAVHKTLNIEWVPVTSESRIDAVASGRVDLECGSTTASLERQKRVAFSPTIFVSGTKLMVRQGSPIKSFRDLVGKTVVVTRGTTNETAMRSLSEKFALNLTLVVMPEHEESFSLLTSGRVDAFATDDVLLYGLLAQYKARTAGQAAARYQVVGDFLSYEPYGIVYRKGDAPFAAVVNEAFHALAEEGEIERQYTRWFLQKLPSGTSIDLPMSPQLETILQTMTVKPE